MARLTGTHKKKIGLKKKARAVVGFPAGERMWDLIKAKRARANRVFPFTYEDIAEAVGLAPRSVQNAARAGKFNPRDLTSLTTYVYRQAQKASKARKLADHTKKRMPRKKGEAAKPTDGKI